MVTEFNLSSLKRLLFFPLLIYVLFFSSAQACIVATKLAEEDLQKADLVFMGHIKSMQFIKDSPGGNAVLKFGIEKVVKGKWDEKTIETLISWGTGGSPSDLVEFQKWYGAKHRVGLIFPETIKKNLNCQETEVTKGDGTKYRESRCSWISPLPVPFHPSEKISYDRSWIVKKPCSDSFILNISNHGR